MPQPQSARSYAAEPPRAEAPRAEPPRPEPMRSEPMRSEPRPEPGYGDSRAPGMHTGRIKFFKPDKGFGFIIPDGGGEDVFLGKDTVAAAGLDRLSQGDRVAYEPGPGNKGIEAKSIRLAS
jgi:cold shock CspA family protein